MEGKPLSTTLTVTESATEAEARLRASLRDGTALAKFVDMAEAQGVAPQVARALAQVRHGRVRAGGGLISVLSTCRTPGQCCRRPRRLPRSRRAAGVCVVARWMRWQH